jgi:hypothetical protein
MKYLRLLGKIWFKLTERLGGFWQEIKSLYVETKSWRCFHCGTSGGQSLDNEWICGACRQNQILTVAMPAPAIKISTASIEVKKKTHFDSCNQSVEIPLTIRELERSGKINTPERVAWAKAMIEKSKTAEKIDYQKHGHPNLDKDFKHPDFVTDEEDD